MILAADNINGVVMVKGLQIAKEYLDSGYKLELELEDFTDSLANSNEPFIFETTSLRQMIKIHKEFGINR